MTQLRLAWRLTGLAWLVGTLLLPCLAEDGGRRHTNNWAVLVNTSRFWFNARHAANTLSMYRTVKRLGIPDSQIILMLADDVACNARNLFPGTVYNDAGRHIDLYDDADGIEVDYRGYEVTVENFIRVLTGRVSPRTPKSKQLLSDEHSNIFIYMTGHGGNEFLKFQDNEEISSHDLANAFEQMYLLRRYHEIFFMIDTCQANTLYTHFRSPGIIATGSSRKGENSYSHHADPDIGVAVIDRYTHYVLDWLERIVDGQSNSTTTILDLVSNYDVDEMMSHPGVRTDLFARDLSQVKLIEFFGNVAQVELTSVPKRHSKGVAPSARVSMNEAKPHRLPAFSIPALPPRPLAVPARRKPRSYQLSLPV